MKKILICGVSLILTVAFATGCSGGVSRNMNTAAEAVAVPQAAPAAVRDSASGNAMLNGFSLTEEYKEEKIAVEADMEAPAPEGGIAGPQVNPVTDSRKIIKNVTLQLQTQTFDTSVEAIPGMVESFGGYIQDSYIEGRDMYNERGARGANFTARIPVEKLDSFVNSVGSEFHVISKNQNSQDITENYYDSKARLDALKIQEERLLEMLKQAAELEYLLQVEKELMNVRYEIESLTSALNRMDSYVSMSTVTIYLAEVVKYEPVENVPVTFGERISRAFSESWKAFGEFAQNFAVWFIAVFPFLLLLAAIAFVVIFIVRRNIRKSAANRSQRVYPPIPPAPQSSSQPAAEEDEH